MLKRVCLLALLVVTGSMVTSCGFFEPRKVTKVTYSKASHGQRIEFHKNEIIKLRAEVDKEKEIYEKNLHHRNMTKARRSKAKITELEKQISVHKKDIIDLEDKGRHLN